MKRHAISATFPKSDPIDRKMRYPIAVALRKARETMPLQHFGQSAEVRNQDVELVASEVIERLLTERLT